MIQANELRLGNLVQTWRGIEPVTLAMFADMATGGWADNKPIPITPELLEKCGFKETHDVIGANTSIPFDYVDYRMSNFVLSVISSGVEIEFAPKFKTVDDRGYIVTVNYLHQLQNLYFFLTGTELTVRL